MSEQAKSPPRASDVVVIGGGIAGLSVALRLCQAGLSVTVLDRGQVGAEASSAAAGILGAQLEADKPGPYLALSLFARQLWPAFSAELRELGGVDVDHQRCGAIEVALDEAALERLEARAAQLSAAGLAAERLDAKALHERAPSIGPRALGGLYAAAEGCVDPRRAVQALVQAAARAGVRLLPASAVRAVRADKGRVAGVELEGAGRIDAGAVVLAAGSWSARIGGVPLVAGAVEPVRGQLATLRPPRPEVPCVLFVHGRGYLVPRSDGRVMAGSTMERVGYDKAVTAGGMARVLSLAAELVPALAAAPLVDSWSGLRPATPDGLPLLGETALPGLFACTGHHRNGVLLAPASAAIVSALVLGQPPPLDPAPFSPARLASLT